MFSEILYPKKSIQLNELGLEAGTLHQDHWDSLQKKKSLL